MSMRTTIEPTSDNLRYHARPRPHTVTRGLPHYVIGANYGRLVRLVRIFNHMQRWHSYESRRMIESQCEQLHRRVYGETVYYGILPPELYAYGSPYI